VSGLPAWLLWTVAHIYYLIGFRNRFVVALNWAWSYITFERGSRLITGSGARPGEQREAERPELHSKAS
jgi:NADH dehydrogenase